MIRIDGYLIDAAINEEHSREGEATQFPVESGSEDTDGVILGPKVYTIDGVVSDTPLGAVELERLGEVVEFEEDDETHATLPSEAALAKLEAIFEARKPVIVESSIRVYENMVMVGLTVPKDGATGDALRFTARFEQKRIRTVSRVAIRVAVPRAGGRKDRGTKIPTAAQAPEETTYFSTEKNGELRAVKYDPEKQRFVDANSGDILSSDETQQWMDQNNLQGHSGPVEPDAPVKQDGPGAFSPDGEAYYPSWTGSGVPGGIPGIPGT